MSYLKVEGYIGQKITIFDKWVHQKMRRGVIPKGVQNHLKVFISLSIFLVSSFRLNSFGARSKVSALDFSTY